ncbi:MAG: tRNA (adenosine(37)-N6)-threonylcarbamoyltransferase complex dimerization subunit type 1 TsaB [Deltaproteobacteria bacterium]|nr:tRNA (adenosine(37)-N6)-threonylcarbamoyltransferase complex dimerization subunit type 1 TsaB [Deltaproteobacteria bacterium]
MWLLGIDTATWTASVGIARDAEAVAERTRRTESSHAPTLIPLIAEVLSAAGITMSDVGAVAVSAGPGSFTGLRIGLGTAKGLAYANRARIVAVPTLAALARAAGPRDGTVCSILDARKGELYAAAFYWRNGGLVECVPAQVVTPQQLPRIITSPCTFIGDGVEPFGDRLRELFGDGATLMSLDQAPPAGAVVAQMGWERLSAGVDDALASLEPHYARPSEAERKAG